MAEHLTFSGEGLEGLFISSIVPIINTIGFEKRVILAQGYGVSSRVPIRFLAYAVPVLRLAKRFPYARITFYFAQEGVIRANGYDRVTIEDNVGLMKRLLLNYIATFHSEVQERVEVLVDKPIDASTQAYIDGLMPSARWILENSPRETKRFVAKRGGESALMYMLEHSLYMRDPILYKGEKSPLLVEGMDYDFDHLIMIGGPAEKIFWEFRKNILAARQRHTEWNSYQFFTPVGNPPTYHYQAGEPYCFDKWPGANGLSNLFEILEEITDPNAKKENLKGDYLTIFQDTAGAEKFSISGIFPFLPEDREILEVGYANFQGWLGQWWPAVE